MTALTTTRIALNRVALVVLGGASAVALWALAENWKDPALSPPLYLALFSFVTVYAAVALALAGPVRLTRALGGALMLAVPATALISLAGLRYEVATDVLDQPILLSVSIALVFFATPFLMVGLHDRSRMFDYAALFESAWGLTARYLIAWGFVAGFWILVFLSDALLRLVQIGVIEAILDIDWMVFGLSGMILGLGLAVVFELRETVSPFVLLRLVRLMVPLVLAVVAIFLLAIPFRGLGQVFGEFSSAATLMTAAIVSITLICTALERNDGLMVQTPGLKLATRALALVLPVLTGLALWAVILRVRQHGWTPDRVLAAGAALFLVTYGVVYAGAALSGTRWSRLIRRANVGMALVVIAVLSLWLTPLLNADRISTRSQVARFVSGQTGLDGVPLWSMAHEWGRAGQAGLMQLEAEAPGDLREELAVRLEQVHLQGDRYRFEQALVDRRAPEEIASLVALMAVRPEGEVLEPGMLAGLQDYRRAQWLEGCRRELPDGRSGCVMILGGFLPVEAQQGMVLYLDEAGQTRVNYVQFRGDGQIVVREAHDPASAGWPVLPETALLDALAGRFELRPRGGAALHLGGRVLEPGQ